MSIVVSTSEIELKEDEAGALRIGKTRVSLDSVLIAFNLGAAPEEIVLDYPTLDLSQVYAAISYYLQHRDEMDSYLAKRSSQRAQLRQEVESRCHPQGIRERLLARRREAA